MFIRVLRDSLFRQKRKKLTVFASVALGASVIAAMLNISLEIGDRIARELRGYGANILVSPASDMLPVQINGLDLGELREAEYLRESDLARVRSEMFWRNNILGFAPFLPVTASVNGQAVPLVGTWFHQTLKLPDGTQSQADVRDVKSYWKIDGGDIGEADDKGAIIGVSLAERLKAGAGDVVNVVYGTRKESLVIRGVLESGGAEDQQIFVRLAVAQRLAGLEGKVKTVLVSALTTPENKLYEKYQRNFKNLTPEEVERYACTPYITNIVVELKDTIPGSAAEPILQVARTEGRILNKIVLLMVLVALAALLAASIAVGGSMTATVMARRKEIGLLKALGAENASIVGLLLTEGLIVSAAGGVAGYGLGGLFSWTIGARVFDHPIGPKAAALPLIVALACLMALLGSLLPARRAMSIDPATTLKGAA